MHRYLLIGNTSFARRNNIGYRLFHVYRQLKADRDAKVRVFVRATEAREQDISVIVPLGEFIPRALNAARIYGLSWWDHRLADLKFFDWNLLRAVQRYYPVCCYSGFTVHSWEYALEGLRLLKSRGARLVVDMPMAHPRWELELEARGLSLGRRTHPRVTEAVNSCLALADRIIVPSEFVLQTLPTWVDRGKVRYVPFGADIPGPPREEKYSAGPITFVFAGAVNERKGIKQLVEAWKIAGLKHCRLLICGRVYASIRQTLSTLPNNAHILGFTDVRPLMERAHVFVLPSLMEGSAKAIFEAMAHGMAVITTPSAGSIVRQGRDGILVEPGDVRGLADAMKYFAEVPDAVRTMGMSAFRRVRGFTWTLYARRVIDVYRSVGE